MTSSPSERPFIYIASNRELLQAACDWSQCDSVAFDTEFMRVNTFYPQAALFQIGTPSNCYLVDPLGISDFEPLIVLLESSSIVKIMHACSEDLEVFNTFLKCQPQAIYDTQIGAAFLGFGLSIGYKNLVDRIFEVDLPKGEQRSDWLQRPLTDKQLSYAAQDVTYLMELYQQQLSALQEKGWLSWVNEELEIILNKQRRTIDPMDAYLRVKGANRLTLQQVQIVHKLAHWREIQARLRDIPRGFILKDQQLLEIAQLSPSTHEALARVEGIRRRVVREDGNIILDLIRQSKEDNAQVAGFPQPLPPRAKPLIKDLQQLLSEVADESGLIPELLLNRRTLVALLTELVNRGEVDLPTDLPAWKKALFGEQLLSLLAAMKEKI